MIESGTPPSAAPAPEEWVLVARLGRTRGLRGELYGDALADLDRVLALEQVWLRSRDGAWLNDGEPLDVVEIRPYKDRLVFRFEGIRKIEAAEPFEHCELVAPRADRPPLEEGEFYLTDLVGCVVYDRASGQKLGAVTGWQEFGGPEVLEVKLEGSGATAWIPFARSICVEIDPAGRRIVVDPPEGLLDLNREEDPAVRSRSEDREPAE